MICPEDATQMRQYNKIGGGISTNSQYTTWELKVCPVCGRKVIEFYSAVLVTDAEKAKMTAIAITEALEVLSQ